MKTLFVFLLLALASSANASIITLPETRSPDLPAGSRVYVVNNSTALPWTLYMGPNFHRIPAGTTREIYIPPGSGILKDPNGVNWNPTDWQTNGSNPWVMQVYCVENGSPPTYLAYGPPAVKLSNPYEDFKMGILAGVAIACSIAGLRVWRRAIAISTT